MTSLLTKLAAATALCLSLAACVPDQAMIDAGLAKPPEPQLVEGVYTARSDMNFTVPAVPVEKVPQAYQRQTVYYPTEEVPGTVIIDPSTKHLYLITGKNQAIRYGISIGREGFQWSGTAVVASRKPWPTWTPPPEMIERDPSKAKWKDGQPGGPSNPLGARALYLESNGRDYGYRIHGTPEWNSIGRNASSGCFRMINQDVMDLYERVPDGAKVIVLTASGEMPKGLNIPPPAPKKKKPAETPAPIVVPKFEVLPPPVLTPAAVAPAAPAAPAPAPAATPAPATEPAAPAETTAPACPVPLVNGACPPQP